GNFEFIAVLRKNIALLRLAIGLSVGRNNGTPNPESSYVDCADCCCETGGGSWLSCGGSGQRIDGRHGADTSRITVMNSKFPPTNKQLRALSNLRTQDTVQDGRVTVQNILVYNYKGEGHIAKQCTAKKRVKDAEWFKEKMLLAQLHTTSNFKANRVYDSDCDDEASACAIFMASLSPAGSINGDTTGSSYDLKLLFEVPHYDTYHEDAILNDVVQETKYNDHFVFNDNSFYELISNRNFISYSNYMVTIENDAAQYVPHLEQDKNAMILSVIEQMKGQISDVKAQMQEKSIVVNELKQLLAILKEKSQATLDEPINLDSRYQKVEDENMSLSFQVSSLVKER
nr:hypothetical protein [Tanacetum cinerariifolium]